MIPQKQQRLRHLLQVINRCPALISGTFVLQLALDINDKIEGAGICMVIAFFSRFVFLLSVSGGKVSGANKNSINLMK